MKYAILGRTGVQVSRIALGTATFGVAPQEDLAVRIVARALDLGINIFDTANSYGNQARFDRPGAPVASERASAEEILGRALAGRRQDVVLCSKVMEPVGAGPNDRGLSRLHIFNQVEQSLRRLKTDHLDVYYAHHPDQNTPLEETVRAFADLIQQGKIRYWALSTFSAWMMTEALWVAERLGAPPPVANQLPYNLSFRMVERDTQPACQKFGVSITAFSPLAGGLLAGGDVLQRPIAGNQRWGFPGFNPLQVKFAEAFGAVASKHGMSNPVLALAWLTSKPRLASAIIGPETLEELEANAAAGDVDLSAEIVAELEAIPAPPPAGPFG
jgi:aryl-alcohol dehydrogenase-like predicted oxidoreductase